MGYLSAVQAAHYLGVAERTVRNMINRGELEVLSADPIRLDPWHVAAVLAVRQETARLELARVRKDPLRLARETRELLHRQYFSANLPQHKTEDQRRRMALVSSEAKTTFGVAALTAVQSDSDGCRWCTAAQFAQVLGTWAPERYSEGFAALFDQGPCEVCRPGLVGPVMDALRARVHGGAVRPSEAPRQVSAAERELAQEWARQRPVTASAQPLQGDDGGRALVARRRREVQARLKAARRSGDTKYALRLQQQLQALTADAAAVDYGRAAVTASARPGRLACGHLLAAGCGCPRRASSRGQR